MKKLLISAGAVLVAAPAFAQSQTFGDVVGLTQTNALGPMGDLVGNVAFVVGVATLLFGIFKLVKSGRGHHGEGMAAGAMFALFIGGAALVAFPSFVGVGPASIFGTDAQTSSYNGQLRSIGGE